MIAFTHSENIMKVAKRVMVIDGGNMLQETNIADVYKALYWNKIVEKDDYITLY